MITTSDAAALNAAKSELALRKRRNELLGADLFGEPAWDMLLELYVALGEERQVAVPELCDSAAVPSSTAFRWLLTLERRGRVQRVADPLAADVELVTLTRAERNRLTQLLRQHE